MSTNGDEVKDVHSSPEHSPRRKDDDDEDRVTTKKSNRDDDKDDDDRERSSDRRGGSDRRGDGETKRRVDDRPEDANRGSTSLLVRNLSYDVRVEEIKRMMEEFGDVRDVYIPQDYHTRRPRGFAFVEFYSADDAAEAHDKLDHAKLAGREIAIVFAKDKRKTPGEMRGGRDVGPRGGGGGGGGGRRDMSRDRGDRDRGDRDRGDRDRGGDRYGDRNRGRSDSRDRDRDHRRRRSPSPRRDRGRSPDSRSRSRSRSR